MSRSLFFAVMLCISACPISFGREWNYKSGNRTISGEVHDVVVVIKLSDGNYSRVSVSQLSAVDQQFVKRDIDKLIKDSFEQNVVISERFGGRQNDPKEAKGGEKPPSVDTAYSLLEKVALQQRLPDQSTQGRQAWLEIQKALAIVRKDQQHLREYASLFLDLQPLYQSKFLSQVAAMVSLEQSSPPPPQSVIEVLGNSTGHIDLHLYRDFVHTYSLIAPHSQAVEKQFENAINTLLNAPEPAKRAMAALSLYGAEGVAKDSLSPLVSAAQNDPSMSVRFAAITALSGFRTHAAEIEPEFKRLYKGASELPEQRVMVWAMAELNPTSAIVKRFIRDSFARHRREATPRRVGVSEVVPDPNLIEWEVDFLNWNEEQAKFALTDLLESLKLEVAHNRDLDRSAVHLLVKTGLSDARVNRFLETQAKEGTSKNGILCDSILKEFNARKLEQAEAGHADR